MRIAIIGAGSVGATLGQAWIKYGEDVIWGIRSPADPKHAAFLSEHDVERADDRRDVGKHVPAAKKSRAAQRNGSYS